MAAIGTTTAIAILPPFPSPEFDASAGFMAELEDPVGADDVVVSVFELTAPVVTVKTLVLVTPPSVVTTVVSCEVVLDGVDELDDEGGGVVDDEVAGVDDGGVVGDVVGGWVELVGGKVTELEDDDDDGDEVGSVALEVELELDIVKI